VALMALFLRQLPDGTRFLLCRTQQKFRLIRRDFVQGKHRLIVQHEQDSRVTTLHHSCRVKPIVTASMQPASA
jgi:hypothetical protein